MKTVIVTSTVVGGNILLMLSGVREPFLLAILVACGVLYVALPLALVSAILFCITLKNHSAVLRRVAVWGFLVAAITASMVPSVVIADVVVGQQLDAAMRFCDRLVPDLDQWKQQHGVYPAAINDLGRTDDLPRLLHGGFYSSDGQTFHFSFIDPRGMMNGVEFYSSDRQWHEWD